MATIDVAAVQLHAEDRGGRVVQDRQDRLEAQSARARVLGQDLVADLQVLDRPQSRPRVDRSARGEADVVARGDRGLRHEHRGRRGDVRGGDLLDDQRLGDLLGRAVMIAELVGPPACPGRLVRAEGLAGELIQGMKDPEVRLLDRHVGPVDLLQIGGDTLAESRLGPLGLLLAIPSAAK